MIRLLNILLFSSIWISLQAQSVIYKPVFLDQCNDSLAENPFWWISDSDTTYYIDDLETNMINLPKPGKYSLFLDIGGEPLILNIKSTGEIIDTFYTERTIIVNYMSNPPFSEFLDCDELANGQITDYYYNGTIRLKSTYKNGQPIDTLKRFYRTGVLKELYIPKKRKRRQITYYANGVIQEDFNFAKRYYRDYYETGEIRELSTWNRNHKHSERTEYYKNGQIRLFENNKTQTQYFSSGIIQRHTTKKEVMILERIFTKYGRPWYEFQSNLYDSTGTKIAFYQFGGDTYFPENISKIKSYLFEKIIFYDKGKITNSFDFFKIDDEQQEYKTIQLLLKLDKENRDD
jgi:antitoxin component YwqK of YwqJK toxin-antitoxin module